MLIYLFKKKSKVNRMYSFDEEATKEKPVTTPFRVLRQPHPLQTVWIWSSLWTTYTEKLFPHYSHFADRKWRPRALFKITQHPYNQDGQRKHRLCAQPSSLPFMSYSEEILPCLTKYCNISFWSGWQYIFFPLHNIRGIPSSKMSTY